MPALRLALIRYILSFNIASESIEDMIDALVALVSDPHPAVRAQAIDALQIDLAFPAPLHTKLFQLFVDHVDDSDPDVASRALQNLGGWIELRSDLFDTYVPERAPAGRERDREDLAHA